MLQVFGGMPDPRVERTKAHRLEVLMFIALCSCLSGGKGSDAMEDYARARKAWLAKRIGMRSVPSHDTFNRLFQCLDPGCFARCLTDFSAALREKACSEVVAFDGKAHRRTASGEGDALHMLNAWAEANRLVLGQMAVGEKGNEITAMPLLMDMLDLKGCVVTSDAINTQKAVAAKAVEKKAGYVLALKGNHPLAYAEVRAHMDDVSLRSPPGFEETGKDHGRVETRRCWQSDAVGWFADRDKWAGLRSFILIESERTVKGVTETQRRYYISSLGRDEAEAARCVRAHWSVENGLHWCLDVVFDEDQSRARTRNAAKNLGTLRAMCLNLVKRMPGKNSMRSKMFQMALNPELLTSALKRI